MKSLSIKSKLLISYLLVCIILVALFSFTSYYLLSNGLRGKTIHPWEMRYAQTEQTADGQLIITGFSGQNTNNNTSLSEAAIMKSYHKDELQKLSSPKGMISLGDTLLEKAALDDLEMSDDYSIWFYTDVSGSTTNIVAVTRSANDTQAIMDTYSQILFIVGPVILVLVGLGGYILIKRSLHPVREMAATVRNIRGNNLEKRLDAHSNDELGYLATTFNHMLARLKDAFDQEKQFTDDASHELRTPLAIIQGEATLTLSKERNSDEYKKSLENIYQETEKMSSILKRLLFLARNEGNKQIELEKLNIKALLEELKTDIEYLCEDKSLQCQLEALEDLFIKGDKVSLRELFFNLIENAIRYTPQGGTIKVTLSKDNSYAKIAVSDTGIGIPEEHLKHIFKRFYRVDKSRSRNEGGAGLGLTICQRIAELHNGTIEVRSIVGEGSTFTVSFPLD